MKIYMYVKIALTVVKSKGAIFPSIPHTTTGTLDSDLTDQVQCGGTSGRHSGIRHGDRGEDVFPLELERKRT